MAEFNENEVINDSEETIEDVEDTTEDTEIDAPKTVAKAEKPKRSPEEELAYHEGVAKRLRKKLGTDTTTEAPQKEQKKESGDFDYGQKAFLRSYDIKGADELELARTEQKRSGLNLDELVDNEYFQGKLKNLREARETSAAVPKGTRRSTQPARDDLQVAVAEYKATGKLPEDRSLREKVVDAATEQSKTGGRFYNA